MSVPSRATRKETPIAQNKKKLTPIADDGDVLISEVDVRPPLSSVYNRTFESFDAWDRERMRIDHPANGGDQNTAGLREMAASLQVLELQEPGLGILLPGGTFPLHVPNEVTVHSISPGHARNVVQNLGLFRKQFCERRILRKGEAVAYCGDIYTAAWV